MSGVQDPGLIGAIVAMGVVMLPVFKWLYSVVRQSNADLQAEVAELKQDRDQWRDRALRAELELARRGIELPPDN